MIFEKIKMLFLNKKRDNECLISLLETQETLPKLDEPLLVAPPSRDGQPTSGRIETLYWGRDDEKRGKFANQDDEEQLIYQDGDEGNFSDV